MDCKQDKELNDKLLNLYDSINNNNITLEKARVLIQTSNTIIRLEVTKIKSEKVIGKTNKFFR